MTLCQGSADIGWKEQDFCSGDPIQLSIAVLTCYCFHFDRRAETMVLNILLLHSEVIVWTENAIPASKIQHVTNVFHIIESLLLPHPSCPRRHQYLRITHTLYRFYSYKHQKQKDGMSSNLQLSYSPKSLGYHAENKERRAHREQGSPLFLFLYNDVISWWIIHGWGVFALQVGVKLQFSWIEYCACPRKHGQ